MNLIELIYNTRDAKGTDIQKIVTTKNYPTINKHFTCGICHGQFAQGIDIHKIVSSNFTDWQYVGDYVCQSCASLFSLFFYSYIQNPNGIRLLNIREMAVEIQKEQLAPFKIVISVSQKKHLFYKAVFNQDSTNFTANLEEEQINCNINKLRELFLFMGSLQALGENKKNIAQGIIQYKILKRIGLKGILYLQQELKSRQMQIPLHLSQKLNISEEEALCNLDLILNQ